MVLTDFVGDQLGTGAVLDDAAFVEYGDLVAELATGQAVADVDRSLIAGNVIELGVDFGLSYWMKCSGCLPRKQSMHSLNFSLIFCRDFCYKIKHTILIRKSIFRKKLIQNMPDINETKTMLITVAFTCTNISINDFNRSRTVFD